MGGDELTKAREEAELTRDDLARLMGVARNTVDRWEMPDGRVPLSKLQRLKFVLSGGGSDGSLVNINVRLSADLLRRVDDKADAEDRSRSQMVRLLIGKGLA